MLLACAISMIGYLVTP